MKVKIGNEIYDANHEPIMLIFENDEQLHVHIDNLKQFKVKEGKRYYCVYPEGTPQKDIEKFMNED